MSALRMDKNEKKSILFVQTYMEGIFFSPLSIIWPQYVAQKHFPLDFNKEKRKIIVSYLKVLSFT